MFAGYFGSNFRGTEHILSPIYTFMLALVCLLAWSLLHSLTIVCTFYMKRWSTMLWLIACISSLLRIFYIQPGVCEFYCHIKPCSFTQLHSYAHYCLPPLNCMIHFLIKRYLYTCFLPLFQVPLQILKYVLYNNLPIIGNCYFMNLSTLRQCTDFPRFSCLRRKVTTRKHVIVILSVSDTIL